ncbi:hypothetical protein QR680_000615 [Steinernema hermaphroditum]|uniref:G-protein coupled receptors family 1 profile domain-containing protein n=1 Tax=Steinernema hermaphroditum TaxID=289476 RepID=A0AA39LED9_9BILA|nr:hypothetical protein QR680_000615 [Steinernema hermaphroditum]
MICDTELKLFNLSDERTVHALQTLIDVSASYQVVHRYLSTIICVGGLLANFMHIIVLTRPVMRKCAINRILSLMAICDMLIMVSYIIFTVRFGFAIDSSDPPVGYDLGWIVFLMVHVVFSIALHTISLYLSVVTAFIRYKALKTLSSKWMQASSACPIFLLVIIFVGFLSIPTFMVHAILYADEDTSLPDSQRLYTVGLSEFATVNRCFMFKINLWLTGIMFKVIPCALLLFFTVALLFQFNVNRRRRLEITSGNSLAFKKVEIHSDRTTKMLTVLLGIYLSTELPQGILAILNGFYPTDIHHFIYLSLGEVLDLLSLINCNACFIVYPCISSLYRDTFRKSLQSIKESLFKRQKSAFYRLTPKESDVFL